ncbi:MAG: Gx transporter family protein [Eubacteriales bacterium]|nr:Gx transporter family protein [Eubacteriales bacterium]
MNSRKIAVYGLMTALAMVLSYVEAMVPVSLGVPGAKLGLPNMVTMVALYTVGARAAFSLSLLRIVLVGLSFGNPFAAFYSFCGFLLSFAVMVLMKRSRAFGILGVSAAGGVMHNVGQLICAAVLVKTGYVFTYLSVLLPAGVIAGVLIGILGGILTKRLKGFIL